MTTTPDQRSTEAIHHHTAPGCAARDVVFERAFYGARRTFEFRTKRRCIDSPLPLSPRPLLRYFAPPQILTKPTSA